MVWKCGLGWRWCTVPCIIFVSPSSSGEIEARRNWFGIGQISGVKHPAPCLPLILSIYS